MGITERHVSELNGTFQLVSRASSGLLTQLFLVFALKYVEDASSSKFGFSHVRHELVILSNTQSSKDDRKDSCKYCTATVNFIILKKNGSKKEDNSFNEHDHTFAHT